MTLKIQGLYRHSKKRAARKLLSDNQVQYSGTVDAATKYFTNLLILTFLVKA